MVANEEMLQLRSWPFCEGVLEEFVAGEEAHYVFGNVVNG
jgi:hypothetical protein